jgi:oxygen-independent coproporphyrinogen-3 oxidase
MTMRGRPVTRSLPPKPDTAWGIPPRALYVHIPFCKSRCHYCDFATEVAPEPVREAYVAALIREFRLLAPLAPLPLSSVFFGGGTPSLLTAAQWKVLLSALRDTFELDPDAEITVEANPGTTDGEKLAVWREYGVNRVSFGAQTFDNRLLRLIGRSHDSDAILAAVRDARAAGLRRINLDLMFGLPEQTLEDVLEAVRAVVAMGVPHVSAYWLKVEPGTPFERWIERGLLSLPGEDVEADMYEAIRAELGKAGYTQYEISNFAWPGEPSRHNLVYWYNEPYLAAGVAAHGLAGGERYVNVRGLDEYQRLLENGQRPVAKTHRLTPQEASEDTMILGLRLAEGVDDGRFVRRHGTSMWEVFGPVLHRLADRGWIETKGNVVRIPEHLWAVANGVFEAFVGASPAD